MSTNDENQKHRKHNKIIEKYRVKHQLTHVDFAKAVIYFKGFAWTTWAGSLAFCYHYQPIQRMMATKFLTNQMNNIQTRYPTAYNWTSTFINNGTTKLAESKYFKPIPNWIGANPTIFSKALCENFVFSKAIAPITIPLSFYAAVHIVINNKKKQAKKLTV